jgi:hypothetical protein
MRQCILLSICLACLQSSCFAEDVRAHAQALFRHARQLTDIRSAGSPAFRLTATFFFVGKDLENVQGTYSEVWVSSSQWRREIVVRGLQRIDVGGADKHWTLLPDGFPQKADRIPPLLEIFPPASQELDVITVTERSSNGLSANCAYTKPLLPNLQGSFCFEKETGLLMEEASPEKRPQSIVRYSCGFRTFRKLGERLFPRDLNCFEDRHKTISVVVDDLFVEPSPDPALFVPPAGAAEVGECSGNAVEPTQTKWGIMLPDRAQILGPVSTIKVWFVVDAKGQPQSVKVMDVPRVKWVNDFRKVIESWRYDPGKCNGKLMPMALSPELPAVLPSLPPSN